MTNPMLAELDEVVRLMEVAHLPELESFKDHVCALDGDTVATCYNNVDHNTEAGDAADAFAAAVNFLRTHHATLADMAKRLEAAGRDAARYRWVRDSGHAELYVHNLDGIDNCKQIGGDSLDAAIDATQEGEG